MGAAVVESTAMEENSVPGILAPQGSITTESLSPGQLFH